MNRQIAAGGFTLIEVLVVLAIVGILLSIGYVGILRYVQKSQLVNAEEQMVQALNSARDSARRLSQDQVIAWTGSAPNYTVTVSGKAVVLPAGVQVNVVPTVSTGSSFAYWAPHGRTSAIDVGFHLIGPGGYQGNVRIVGVTGKVVRDVQ